MPTLTLPAFLLPVWLCCAALLSAGGAASAASGPGDASPVPRVWSGVILATNQPKPGEPVEQVRPYAGKLRNIFGYNQYELIGESSQKLEDFNERWLVPSRDFSLSVRRHIDPATHRPAATVSLFEGNRRLAHFVTHFNSASPLFIRGPYYGHGQLLIVLRGDAIEGASGHEEAHDAALPGEKIAPRERVGTPEPAHGEAEHLHPNERSAAERSERKSQEHSGPYPYNPSERFSPGEHLLPLRPEHSGPGEYRIPLRPERFIMPGPGQRRIPYRLPALAPRSGGRYSGPSGP